MSVQLHIPAAVPPEKGLLISLDCGVVWAADTEDLVKRATSAVVGNITTIPHLIFVVPCIMLNSEINPTRCNNCVYSSQWLYSTCFR